MAPQTVAAEFPNEDLADRAIGRLEILGVPPENIQKSRSFGTRIRVTASVEDRLADKARTIVDG